eukprot:scaffold230448_cov20-Tisochrysis_lutea.AAC.4
MLQLFHNADWNQFHVLVGIQLATNSVCFSGESPSICAVAVGNRPHKVMCWCHSHPKCLTISFQGEADPCVSCVVSAQKGKGNIACIIEQRMDAICFDKSKLCGTFFLDAQVDSSKEWVLVGGHEYNETWINSVRQPGGMQESCVAVEEVAEASCSATNVGLSTHWRTD